MDNKPGAMSPMGLPRPSDTKLVGVLYKYIENNQHLRNDQVNKPMTVNLSFESLPRLKLFSFPSLFLLFSIFP